MKVKLPNKRTLFTRKETTLLVEIDKVGWATVGYLGSDSGLLIDKDMWPAFVKLVMEVDREMRRKK